MACLAGVSDPFRRAEVLPRESTGWTAGAEAIRRRTHAEAATATRARDEREALPAAFARAQEPTAERPGPVDAEARIDAGKVNATGGWRDVTVAAFAVRGRAGAGESAEASSRALPAPAARSAIAAAEEVGPSAPRCRAEADRPGLTDPSRLTVPGDGAEWIRNPADERFPSAGQVPDYYRAAEHLASAGRASLGAAAFPAWLAGATGRLPADGYAGACESLHESGSGAAAGAASKYLAGHRDRLHCAARWRRGQAIGSGPVGGTIEQRVNRRLKRTGARWRVEHVGPLVEFLALSDTPEWAEYWNPLAA